mmetsp:Transcript_33334/g.68741  ORF Transcript_33334/g.68741 Transcript_33334/m.68741 type:complete len:82 (+) Transcript_33334:790-1035(+)
MACATKVQRPPLQVQLGVGTALGLQRSEALLPPSRGEQAQQILAQGSRHPLPAAREGVGEGIKRHALGTVVTLPVMMVMFA